MLTQNDFSDIEGEVCSDDGQRDFRDGVVEYPREPKHKEMAAGDAKNRPSNCDLAETGQDWAH